VFHDPLMSNFQEADAAAEETKKSNHVQRKLEKRQKDRKLDSHIEEQFAGGRLLACISSRPGQCGRADGYALTFICESMFVPTSFAFLIFSKLCRYILEGKELEFYMKKLQKKKGKGAA